MCMGAIKQARIKKVYFGAYDDKINELLNAAIDFEETRENDIKNDLSYYFHVFFYSFFLDHSFLH